MYSFFFCGLKMLLESCVNTIMGSSNLFLAYQGNIISHYEGSVTTLFLLFYSVPMWLIFESHVMTVQMSKHDTKVSASSSYYITNQSHMSYSCELSSWVVPSLLPVYYFKVV